MRHLTRKLFLSFALTIGLGSTVYAGTIEGNWRTTSGEIAKISKCGSSYCVKLATSKLAGKQIGKMAGSNGKFKGTLTDPKDDKTYNGTGTLKGDQLSMRGCAYKIFCKTQVWKRVK